MLMETEASETVIKTTLPVPETDIVPDNETSVIDYETDPIIKTVPDPEADSDFDSRCMICYTLIVPQDSDTHLKKQHVFGSHSPSQLNTDSRLETKHEIYQEKKFGYGGQYHSQNENELDQESSAETENQNPSHSKEYILKSFCSTFGINLPLALTHKGRYKMKDKPLKRGRPRNSTKVNIMIEWNLDKESLPFCPKCKLHAENLASLLQQLKTIRNNIEVTKLMIRSEIEKSCKILNQIGNTNIDANVNEEQKHENSDESVAKNDVTYKREFLDGDSKHSHSFRVKAENRHTQGQIINSDAGERSGVKNKLDIIRELIVGPVLRIHRCNLSDYQKTEKPGPRKRYSSYKKIGKKVESLVKMNYQSEDLNESDNFPPWDDDDLDNDIGNVQGNDDDVEMANVEDQDLLTNAKNDAKDCPSFNKDHQESNQNEEQSNPVTRVAKRGRPRSKQYPLNLLERSTKSSDADEDDDFSSDKDSEPAFPDTVMSDNFSSENSDSDSESDWDGEIKRQKKSNFKSKIKVKVETKTKLKLQSKYKPRAPRKIGLKSLGKSSLKPRSKSLGKEKKKKDKDGEKKEPISSRRNRKTVKCDGVEDKYMYADEFEFNGNDQDGFRCALCPAVKYRALDCVRAHIRLVHIKVQGTILCPICGNLFKTPGGLDLHLRTHTEKQIPCTLCDEKFRTEALLDTHFRNSHVDKSVVCEHCGKVLPDRVRANRHVQAVHLKEKRFFCEQCGKGFYGSTGLQFHMSSHSTDKPFACKFCSQRFTRHCHRERHQKQFHEFQLKAEAEAEMLKAGKQDPQLQEQLQKQQKKQQGKKSNNSKVISGVEVVLEEQEQPQEIPDPRKLSLKCTYCGLQYNRQNNLTRHLLQIHNVNVKGLAWKSKYRRKNLPALQQQQQQIQQEEQEPEQEPEPGPEREHERERERGRGRDQDQEQSQEQGRHQQQEKRHGHDFQNPVDTPTPSFPHNSAAGFFLQFPPYPNHLHLHQYSS